MNLRKTIFSSFFSALLFAVQPAHAQLAGDTTAAGDSCVSYPQGGTALISDSDGDYRDVVLICDGTNWQAAEFTASGPFEYSSSGNAYAILSTDIPSAIGFLDNTYANVDWSKDHPIIGYTSSGHQFIGTGTSWSNKSGMWADSYRSWFGQAYDENGGLPDFTGMYVNDGYILEFEYYGDTIFSMRNGGFALGNSDVNSTGTILEIRKSRGTGPVQNADEIGAIGFYGKETTNSFEEFGANVAGGVSIMDALIRVSVEAGTIDTSIPTKMTFHTTSATGALSEKMVIDGDGNVGIGDTDPAVALDVVGDINYTGVIQDVSDRRLKENVKPLEGSLKGITSLDGYSFTMKGDDAAVREYGLMAQDVEEVFPELVTTGEDGFKTMNYIGLIAPLVESVKDLSARIEALEAENQSLKAQIEGK